MPKLIAKTPILYLTHMYKVGESLPLNNRMMVDAWTKAGTAEWLGAKEEAAPVQTEKAESSTETKTTKARTMGRKGTKK